MRRLRTELSHWVEQARRGHEVTITDRGAPVAKLVPLAGESMLDRLVRDGLATPPRRPKRPISRPTVRSTGGTVGDILEEQRRERPW